MSKDPIKVIEELEKKYEFHEEYPTKEAAEDVVRCNGVKDYHIIKGCSCWHYLYNLN